MTLTHNRTSGHIKLDGAIIGTIKLVKKRYVFVHYKFKSDLVSAASVKELLPLIRQSLEERA